MHERRIPEWLRHSPTPTVRGFAMLAGAEAIARGILITVFPLVMYRALGDAKLVSQVYFLVGIASLVTGLMVPYLIRFVPRRWVYVSGNVMFLSGALIATVPTAQAAIAGLALVTMAVVTCFVCFNAYVLDYVAKFDLGRLETSRLVYSAFGWTVGPVLGVILYGWWRPMPFLVAAAGACAMMVIFMILRMGNGKNFTRAKRPPASPLAYFPRFFAQPRLIAGWLFAVLRSCGWWVYVVYLPIFAVENGLGEQMGGIAQSVSNAFLFLAPVMLRFVQAVSLKRGVQTGFLMSAILFAAAGLFDLPPMVAVLCLIAGAFFLILLDVCGGLPFLLAVKPSERTEMSAIYSSFRDVSGILTPGAAWLVLLVAPLTGVFVAGGGALLVGLALTRGLHPRLGHGRVAAPRPVQGEMAEAA